MVSIKKEIEFLEAYRIELLQFYETFQEITLQDLVPSTEQFPKPDEKAMQASLLAKEVGFDGGLFFKEYDDPTTLQALNNLSKRIELIPQIIAEIDKPVDRSAIPDDVLLLTIPQVARLLGWGESVVRERDKKGLLPIPIRTGGTIQWNRQEFNSWLTAGCPARQKWEMTKTGKGE